MISHLIVAMSFDNFKIVHPVIEKQEKEKDPIDEKEESNDEDEDLSKRFK